jgi:hypothetical protein
MEIMKECILLPDGISGKLLDKESKPWILRTDLAAKMKVRFAKHFWNSRDKGMAKANDVIIVTICFSCDRKEKQVRKLGLRTHKVCEQEGERWVAYFVPRGFENDFETETRYSEWARKRDRVNESLLSSLSLTLLSFSESLLGETKHKQRKKRMQLRSKVFKRKTIQLLGKITEKRARWENKWVLVLGLPSHR